MENRFKLNRLVAGGIFVTASMMLGSGPIFAEEKLKVGFVYPSPIGDNGWSHRHEVGRQDVIAHFGDQIETTFVESVPEGPDATRVITQLALTGHELIFTTSFGFMEPTLQVAEKFPNVHFENNTGFKTAPNVSVYNARFHEGRVVFGTIAGMMTETNTVGYVASFPIPEVIMGINAFTLAAQKVNPDVEVKVVWVNTWYNPALEADAAQVLLDQGADFITQHTNSPAPCQRAEEAGVFCFGQDADMSQFAQKAHLTGIVNNWGPYYIRRVQDVLDGTWETDHTWDGISGGLVMMAPYNDTLSDDVKAAATKVEQALKDGTLNPFAGPITNANGEMVIEEGEALTDKQVHEMNWFVQGVDGELPS
ncbi:BMP family ABC transporter substrate-binding protein [uncultured Ruegeria sp.]|uniref:BMP family ABC transporter substrate-binding protein n=1 Tax=uncultured Ruegeria sp. TaxID=259304 RepID=UPI00263688F1|nr:BMP family ABC transporter substrate-binding protein [uncultured Ruegeria sp.]